MGSHWIPLKLVNDIRTTVLNWQVDGYPGITQTSRDLINHWPDEEACQLYFAQLDAVLTHIYLNEAATDQIREEIQGINDRYNNGIHRIAHKMATATGKTPVMAMLILYHTANHRNAAPDDHRFARRFLVITPGLTVRERLQDSLDLGHHDSDWKAFNLVPPGDQWEQALTSASVNVINYHQMQPKDMEPTSTKQQQLIDGGSDPTTPEEMETKKETPRDLERIMLSGSVEDRRELIRAKLEAMADQSKPERTVSLREITTSVLSFSPSNDAPIAVESNVLPSSGTIIGKLENIFGPDFTAIHFDLSAESKTTRPTPRITNPQIQAANAVVQQYAQEEQNPLLIFTLPDDSGLQLVTGNLSPGNANRLDDVLRLSIYWRNLNRTAIDCLDRIGLEVAGDEVPERAFRTSLSIQPVTSEFFKDYKFAYDRTVASLEGTLQKEEAEQFTQTLFNRLLFIQFISKKGWITWNNDPDYLKALLRDYEDRPDQTNFHADRLSVVFHEGMNTPEDQRNSTTELLIGNVPFLNGGLFDRNELDQRDIQVDDEIVSEIVGPAGLFSQYNFTVTEATPLDTEVAVDPEMLGKLFEETVNERHSNGAYYTPRPVVSYMCREALKGFINERGIANLDEDRIAELVDERSPDAVTQPQALEIAKAVSTLRAVDPACGSGAFLLGMLQEILALNDTLFRAGKSEESLYKQKLDIIANNIYGADKDGLAVSTAMLRLWLSPCRRL